MDSLHLFTIPNWLPDNIPSELWAIIFYWKWKYEMENIYTELLDKTSKIHTKNIDFDKFICDGIARNNKFQGDYWFTYHYIIPFKEENGNHLTEVNVKCGIEILNYYHTGYKYYYPIVCRVFVNKNYLHKHLQENLGITCSQTLDYKDMIQLLRTV